LGMATRRAAYADRHAVLAGRKASERATAPFDHTPS
jgi:hypothetical protein